jgi:NADPH:quinone reductase
MKGENNSMKAVGLYRTLPIDDPQSLVDLEMPALVPSGRDLLVRVKAVSVNVVDVKLHAPKATTNAQTKPRILGWDVAGVVEAPGDECALFSQGDEVYYAGSVIRPGGNSELHLVDERIVGRKPKNLDFAEAAALPLTTITAWEALFDRLRIPLPGQADANRGQTILIVGAAGGVGSIATQLAKWAGLSVIGTASRPERARWAREHGADHIIDHYQPFGHQLERLGHPTVEYILCLNSTEGNWANMVSVISPQGMICAIVGADGPLPITELEPKSVTFVWELMFTRSMFQTPDMIEQHRLLNRVAELVETGALQTTLTQRLSPITAATLRQAHAAVESGSMIGKVVLERFAD